MNKYINPKNYWNKLKINWRMFYYDYNVEKNRMIERKKFDKLGFQYDEAWKKLDEIRSKPNNPDLSGQKCMERFRSEFLLIAMSAKEKLCSIFL